MTTSQRIPASSLACYAYGRTDAPPLVLIHGLAEQGAFFWQALIDAFADQYRIVAFDLPGHGSAARPFTGYGLKAQAARVMRAMKSLDIAPAVVIGHSMGGILAGRLACDYPSIISRLVIYASPIPGGIIGNLPLLWHLRWEAARQLIPLLFPGSGWIMSRLPADLRRAIIAETLHAWRVPLSPAKRTAEYIHRSSQNDPRALADSLRGLVIYPNLRRDLPRIAVPTLIIAGERDVLVSRSMTESTAAAIPNARVALIPDAGHAALIDQPDAFIAALSAFLVG
jgi:pimeloyl-ACP methyl ester carboxylesterase